MDINNITIMYMNKIRKTLHIPSSVLKSDIFDTIDTEEKAYILGVVIADGNVHYGDSIRLTIGMSGYDSEVFRVIAEYFGFSTESTDISEYSSISICSKRLVMEISKYGIIPNKRESLMLPMLEHEMMPHLIRGIIDGDGFISDVTHSIGICGNSKLLSEICTYLTEHLGVKLAKSTSLRNSSSVKVAWTRLTDVQRICNWIYGESSTLYVDRKYEKWIGISNYIGNRPFRIPVKNIRVRQYTLDGTFVKEYENTAMTSAETGISKESILQNCKKKSKTAGKYVFKFNDDDFSKYCVARK